MTTTPKTLKHHRKTDNTYRFQFGRQTITLTRRFLPSRAVRVRVTSTTLSGTGEGNWTEYRDFTDMHKGDAAFSRQAASLCRQWEKRTGAAPKKETTVNTPDPTPTQAAAGFTATPAQAAEIATRTTGIYHQVGEDGRTVCRRPAAAPQPVEGAIAGRVLGEYTVKVRNPRMGRSDAMLMLLQAMDNHITAAEMATHARRIATRTGHPDTERAADDKVTALQVDATYFRTLRDAGYAQDTTWDELIDMLRPIVSTALYGLDDQRNALERTTGTAQIALARGVHAAELFLTACAPILSFFKDDDA